MKKIIAIGIIGMFLLTSFSVFVIADKKNTCSLITTSYSFETPVIKNIDIDGSVYVRVDMKDAPCGGNPGEPRLPAKGAYILLPQGKRVSDIIVTPGEMVCLGSGFVVEPVEEPVPLSEINLAPLPIPNKIIYSSRDTFPGRLFTNIGTGNFRGYQILVLKLHPVQYIPITGELFYYPDLTISVETVEDENANTLYRGLEKDKLEVIKKVNNPCVADTYLQTKSRSNTLDLYDMLIITTDSLKDSFEPLAIEHNNSGVRTIIKTLSDIGCNTPEEIRDYIRDAYNDMEIEYVLIGGDHDIVPAKKLYFGWWKPPFGYGVYEYGPADIYYSDLDSLYDLGDIFEPDGSGDYYAETESKDYESGFAVGLFTPPLNLAGYDTVNLSCEIYFFNDWGWSNFNYMQVNTYSGGTDADHSEETLWEQQSSYQGPVILTFDPSKYSDPSDVYIEFYYNNTAGPEFTSTFNIDDVCVKVESKETNEKQILWESFEGDVFPPTGWTQIKYQGEGEWKKEYYTVDIKPFAEVFVGRACVGNAAEVDTFVSKTIAYMNLDPSEQYLKRVLLAGQLLGFFDILGGTYLNELIGVCRNHGYKTVGFSPLKYQIYKLYDGRIWRWPKTTLINRVNNNVHIICHDGHADYDYDMKIYISDVDKLTNDKHCFIYSVGCFAGGFDYNDCIAEHLTVKTEYGAFAGIWNSRLGWYHARDTDGMSQRYHREFWDAVFSENITVISRANQDSKEDNIYRINEIYMRWVCYGLNLLGDPAIQFKYLGSEISQSSQQNNQFQGQNYQGSQNNNY